MRHHREAAGDWQWGTELPWTLWWVYWLVRPPYQSQLWYLLRVPANSALKCNKINFPKRKFTSNEIAWKSIFNRVRNAEENKSLENGDGGSVITDGKFCIEQIPGTVTVRTNDGQLSKAFIIYVCGIHKYVCVFAYLCTQVNLEYC